jgi:hypothetical protein
MYHHLCHLVIIINNDADDGDDDYNMMEENHHHHFTRFSKHACIHAYIYTRSTYRSVRKIYRQEKKQFQSE